MADVRPKRFPDVTEASARPFTFKWDDYLPAGVTISSATITTEPTGPSIGSVSLSNSDTWATATLSAFQAGARYVVNCIATLSNGEIEEARAEVFCKPNGET